MEHDQPVRSVQYSLVQWLLTPSTGLTTSLQASNRALFVEIPGQQTCEGEPQRSADVPRDHQAKVADWIRRNPGAEDPAADSGYPCVPMPGTEPPGHNECYKCGQRGHHRSPECNGTALRMDLVLTVELLWDRTQTISLFRSGRSGMPEINPWRWKWRRVETGWTARETTTGWAGRGTLNPGTPLQR